MKLTIESFSSGCPLKEHLIREQSAARNACYGPEIGPLRTHPTTKNRTVLKWPLRPAPAFPSSFQFVGMFSPNRTKLSLKLPRRVYLAEMRKPVR